MMKFYNFISRLMWAIVIAGPLTTTFIGDAYATVCTPPFPSIEEAFIHADIVFAGVAVSNETVEEKINNSVIYTNYEIFKIKELFKSPKGFSRDSVYVDRGLEKPLDIIGQEFIVYGKISKNRHAKQDLTVVLSKCTRTSPSFAQEIQLLQTAEKSPNNHKQATSIPIVGKINRISLQKEKFGAWDHIPTIKSELFLTIESFPFPDTTNTTKDEELKLNIGNEIKVTTFYCENEFKISESHLLNVQLRHPPHTSVEYFLECDGGKIKHKNKEEQKILKRLSR